MHSLLGWAKMREIEMGRESGEANTEAQRPCILQQWPEEVLAGSSECSRDKEVCFSQLQGIQGYLEPTYQWTSISAKIVREEGKCLIRL